jgi:hypothetical protein
MDQRPGALIHYSGESSAKRLHDPAPRGTVARPIIRQPKIEKRERRVLNRAAFDAAAWPSISWADGDEREFPTATIAGLVFLGIGPVGRVTQLGVLHDGQVHKVTRLADLAPLTVAVTP